MLKIKKERERERESLQSIRLVTKEVKHQPNSKKNQFWDGAKAISFVV